jgi:hypothetical protein
LRWFPVVCRTGFASFSLSIRLDGYSDAIGESTPAILAGDANLIARKGRLDRTWNLVVPEVRLARGEKEQRDFYVQMTKPPWALQSELALQRRRLNPVCDTNTAWHPSVSRFRANQKPVKSARLARNPHSSEASQLYSAAFWCADYYKRR